MEKQTRSTSFLLVDPDAIARDHLRRILENGAPNGPVSIRAVSSLKEAVSILDSQPIQVVISAWDLSGKATALPLLKLIRGEERFRDVRFILISSVSEDEPQKVRAARAAKVDGYLLKPLNEEALRNLLRDIL